MCKFFFPRFKFSSRSIKQLNISNFEYQTDLLALYSKIYVLAENFMQSIFFTTESSKWTNNKT